MPRSYKLITALLAFTGCISLLITGELTPLLVIPGIAIIPGYYRYIKGYEPAPRWVITALAAVTAGLVALDTLAVSGDFFVAVAHMTVIFQAIKSFDLREPWDHLQVFFMALLQLIITSELAISMAVGGMFVVFLVVFVAAIVLSHFMKEGTLGAVRLSRPVAVITLIAFAATAVFFLAVPRARGSIWQRKSGTSMRMVGFSGNVDFGSFGDVLEDSSIVMRVSITGPSLPLYWRGTTLDYFDGTAWKDTLQRRIRETKSGGRFSFRHRGSSRPVTAQKIYLEPIDTDVVFGLGEMTAVESPGWYLFRDSAGSIYLPFKSDRRFTYTAYSIPEGDLDARQIYVDYYLQLPTRSERIGVLARRVAGSAASEAEAASRVEAYLKTNYSYSLKTSPPPGGLTPIEDFLFNSRAGYCEHFATSMVLMLRSLGIPARIVTGFHGGETSALGDYIIVRQQDAHSWVEAAIDGKWVRFDPTPPGPQAPRTSIALLLDSLRMDWYRYVVGYDTDDQRAIFSFVTSPNIAIPEFAGIRLNVRPIYLVALTLLFALLAGRLLLRQISSRRTFESKAYLRLKSVVKRRGGTVRPSSTPGEVLHEARRLSMDAESAAELIKIYEDARFGGQELDREARSRCKELVSAISSGK